MSSWWWCKVRAIGKSVQCQMSIPCVNPLKKKCRNQKRAAMLFLTRQQKHWIRTQLPWCSWLCRRKIWNSVSIWQSNSGFSTWTIYEGAVSQTSKVFITFSLMDGIQELSSMHVCLHFHKSGQVFLFGKMMLLFSCSMMSTPQFVSDGLLTNFYSADLILLGLGHQSVSDSLSRFILLISLCLALQLVSHCYPWYPLTSTDQVWHWIFDWICSM